MSYQYLSQWILDLVFPMRCLGCGRFETPNYCCPKCLASIPIKSGFENYLGQPLDQLFIASDYNHPLVQKLIKAYKYKFIKDIHRPLADLVFKYLTRLGKRGKALLAESPLLIAVPLHPRRLNWRGFNQAEHLARALAEKHILECEPGILKRNRVSLPQADISEREKRLNNLAGAFSCSSPERVKNRTILLIDDVCTTGATLNECAKILKSAGAKSVKALVIARG